MAPRPLIKAFFDEPTNTVSYLVADPVTRSAAVIDPVLDYDHKTGEAHYLLQRVRGLSEVFSSPVGAAGRVYLPGRDGATLVLRHGPTYEVLATNRLDDGFDASPALAGDEMYLRGNRYLYCIATP